MKRFLIALAFLTGSFSYAQQGSQEVSVDIGNALVMKTLVLNYEYYLTDQSTVGLSALFNFEKKSKDFTYNEKNMFTPFFRHYFTANQNWNYFGEIFLGINSGEKEYKEDGKVKSKDYTDGALGVSLGSKYVSNGGFMLSVLGGIGRNMFTDEAPIIVPRVSVNVGYRF